MCLDATTTPKTVQLYSDGKYFGKMMKRALERLKGYKYPRPSVEVETVGKECKNLIKNYTVFKDEEDLHKAFEKFCDFYDLIFEHWKTISDPKWIYEGFTDEEIKQIEALGPCEDPGPWGAQVAVHHER